MFLFNSFLKKIPTTLIFLCFLSGYLFAETANPSPENPSNALEKPVDSKYVSSMKEKGLDPEFMRHMFVEPDLARATAQQKSLWLGDVLRFGMYLRPRQELRENLDFNASERAVVDRTLQTSTLFFIIDPSPYVQAKVTIQDARVWGGEAPAPTGDLRANFFNNTPTTFAAGQTAGVATNQTGIREAFVILNQLPLQSKIQIGRQIWAYGDQRMLGGGNWTINGLSFDGVRLMFQPSIFKIHFLMARPYWTQSGVNGVVSSNDPKVNSNAQGTDTTLFGTYNSVTLPEWFTLDLYALGVVRKWKKNPINPTTGLPQNSEDDPLATTRSRQTQNLVTVGFRVTNRTKGNFLPEGKNWDWTWESAFQSGTSGRRIQDPYLSLPTPFQNAVTERERYVGQMHVFQTGYTFFKKLRFGGQVLYASGDKNRADGSVSTFQSLANPRFGVVPYFNHIAGISENINAQNLLSKSIHVSYKTDSWGEFQISYFQNDKAEKQDAWYAISGAANSTRNTNEENSSPVAADKGSTENFANNPYSQPYRLGKRIYTEIDVTWMGKLNDFVSIWVGVGVLRAGDSIKNYRNSLLRYDVDTQQFVWNQDALQGKNLLARDGAMAYAQVNASF